MPEIYTYWTDKKELGFHYEEFAGDVPIEVSEKELTHIETCDVCKLHDMLRLVVLKNIFKEIEELCK